MEKVECPTCGNAVFLVPTGTTVEVRGRLDLTRCLKLQHLQSSGEEISDPLECEDMEAAVDAAMAAVSEATAEPPTNEPDPLLLWRDQNIARRHYIRWPTNRPGQVGLAGHRHRCIIRDISPGGACVAMHDIANLRPDAFVVLTLEGFGAVPAGVRSLDEADELARLCFLHDATRQAALARWLMSLPEAPALGE